MKLIQEPIVFADETDNPLCHFFQWRQRIYYVHQLLEDWFYRGKWWQDPRLEGERRHYFRVSSYQLPPNSKVFPPGSKSGDLSALSSVRYAPEIRMHQTYSDSFSRRRVERTAWTPEQLGCRPEQTKIFELFFLSPGARPQRARESLVRSVPSYAASKVAKPAEQLRGQQSQSERSNSNRKGGLRPEPGVQGSALVRPEFGVQGSALASWILSRCLD
jgi:hypothetical protein